jgi:formyltetrahydrofolate synthetase
MVRDWVGDGVAAANSLLAAAIDARMVHEAAQKDETLFR